MRTFSVLLMLLISSYAPNVAEAADSTVDYLKEIKPLLKERCFSCHGALKQEAGLRLDTAELMKSGGDSGPAIDLNLPVDDSLILKRVSETDPQLRMPPQHEGEQFRLEQIDLLRTWIKAGAKGPADEKPEADPADHWSFRPITRPELPKAADANWAKNPIDHFLSEQHQLHGLKPAPEAPRAVLLRRLYIDLIGLPPTAEEIAQCEEYESDTWYEETVDRLLADPRHGERWARHWMDIWRYSDSYGFSGQLRNSQKHMWHYRDWIVESLNKNTPYDEMIQLMLAADELAPNDPDRLRAGGYLARNYFIFNRSKWMEETVEHVGKGILAMTFNCAKCHDHKFDPIAQEDFYKIRAFFEPYQVRLDMVPGQVNLDLNGIPRPFDGNLDAPTYLFVRGEESQADKSRSIPPGVPEILTFDEFKIQKVNLPVEAYETFRRPGVLANHIAASNIRLQTATERVTKAQTELDDFKKHLLAQEGQTADPDGSNADQWKVTDRFASIDQSRWKVVGGEWKEIDGQLNQMKDGPQQSSLILTEIAPTDFDATLRYRLNGGSQWRSVGISFDVNYGDQALETAGTPLSSNQVYISGAASDSKVQAAYSEGGKSNFPAEGRQGNKIEVGQEYTLRVQVRGTLVNASINGQPSIAWRTPLGRRNGYIQLNTFDALATFLDFTITPLDKTLILREAASNPNPVPMTLHDAEQKLATSQAEMNVASRERDALTALAAVYASSDEQSKNESKQERRERLRVANWAYVIAKAELNVVQAQSAWEVADAAKKEETLKALDSAKAKLAEWQSLAANGEAPSSELPVAKGAAWTPTRFLNTSNDDPNVAFPESSTGRRTAFANWVTDRRNPLTARVAANHIWTRHIGTSLAGSVFDFGRNAPNPTNPEVLDWLAAELIDSNWNMKHLHRLIVTSAAYRMSSSLRGQEANLEIDSDNKYFWRRVPMRIESQVVRDSVLSFTGSLDQTMGGPSIPQNEQANSKRRSLYFVHSGDDRNLFLTTFDDAMVGECYRREESVVPQQALALANSELILESALQISTKFSEQAPNEVDFIRHAFKAILVIDASTEEVAACQRALEQWRQLPGNTDVQARSHLVWALLNHNDFVSVR
ncbi:DUF1553 domain-containing protein [Planctomicrobium sp. SH668]|uniref:PSD1 and planctomycete cytochrome C domain-containing protein n=1 Tax=Planctomicrobium sp. SH668 TaxID=3448126 RepID=UPI003F5B1E3A